MTHILCLDDDPELLRLLRVILETSGYKCSCAADSHEALVLLRTQSIDLFIQDMRRPDIGGESLCQMIKDDENIRHIPILIASAYIAGGQRMVAEGYADAFVSEPLGPIELLKAVEGVLNKHAIPLATGRSPRPGAQPPAMGR